jgi:hypothetical protein
MRGERFVPLSGVGAVLLIVAGGRRRGKHPE